MRSVLLSVQPKWCELIFSGEKILDVRKSKPKHRSPFKVFIYATKQKHFYHISRELLVSGENLFLVNGKVKMCDPFDPEVYDKNPILLNGYVIGEFICKGIMVPDFDLKRMSEQSCLTVEELLNYSNGKPLYGWRISDLILYDSPKMLCEFQRPCACVEEYEGIEYSDCLNCDRAADSDYGIIACNRELKSLPFSWCYVEHINILDFDLSEGVKNALAED